LNAQISEDSDDLDYVWNMINQPDASMVNPNDFLYSENRSTVNFIPDKPGIYELEVSVSQYGDALSVQPFIIDVEAGLNPPTAVENTATEDDWIETEEDEKWLETEQSEELIEEKPILSETSVKDTIISEHGSEIPDTVELTIPIVDVKKKDQEIQPKKTSPPQRPKPVIHKGSTIPIINNRFTIQLASKKLLSDAEAMAASLIDDGFDAYIQKAYFKETDEIWYRIRVGSYDSREAATLVAKTITKKRGISTWVDHVRLEE